RAWQTLPGLAPIYPGRLPPTARSHNRSCKIRLRGKPRPPRSASHPLPRRILPTTDILPGADRRTAAAARRAPSHPHRESTGGCRQ
ncbi:hypothetical protein LEFCBN_LEFCBN_14430, partial [Dysosmobacter welbionis]